MLEGEIVAFLTIVGGGILSAACYLFIATRSKSWVLGVDAVLGILGNCFTLVPATYFLVGVIVEVGLHLFRRGDPPSIPMSGNEPTLVLVFAYAIFLCFGSTFRIYDVALAHGGRKPRR